MINKIIKNIKQKSFYILITPLLLLNILLLYILFAIILSAIKHVVIYFLLFTYFIINN